MFGSIATAIFTVTLSIINWIIDQLPMTSPTISATIVSYREAFIDLLVPVNYMFPVALFLNVFQIIFGIEAIFMEIKIINFVASLFSKKATKIVK